MYPRRSYRRNYTPKCPVHPAVALKMGQCRTCAEINEAARQAAIKAQPDVREYVSWNGKTCLWSPSYQPLYMILLDRVPEYTDENGVKSVFQFGSSSLAGSHARTVEEVRKSVQHMLTTFPKFNWKDITIKIVNAPCVWDATTIHEVVEEIGKVS